MTYSNITLAIVVWNDAERLRALLEHCRPWFEAIVVAVQESPDDTLEVATAYADIVKQDEHRGFGDASFGPLLQPVITTPWTFKLDADEWPSDDLLENLGQMAATAEERGLRGVWIPFRSWTDGFEWKQPHSHLRLWKNEVIWPAKLHSRPMIDDTYESRDVIDGHISHTRSLDEMMRDYLNYYRIGIHDVGWERHNREMMRDACVGMAKLEGWAYIRSHDWWPQVRDIAFGGNEPMEPNTVFCAGPSCSGTRMLYDMVGALGFTAIHASIPGYWNRPEGGLDTDNPNWWPVSEWVERFGYGKWVIITRDPECAGRCAERRHFVPSFDDYEAYRQRAMDILSETPPQDTFRFTYEALVEDPQGVYDRIADFLGAPHVQVGDIFDGNQKYLSPEPAPAPARRARRASKKES